MRTCVALSALMAGILLIGSLVGCETRNSAMEVRSVEWYETYETERSEKLAECRARPDILDGTPNCVNASRAESNVQDATKWANEREAEVLPH